MTTIVEIVENMIPQTTNASTKDAVGNHCQMDKKDRGAMFPLVSLHWPKNRIST